MREIPAKIKPTKTRNGDNEVDPRRRHTSGLTLTVAKVTKRGGQGRGLEGSERGGRRERERERERERRQPEAENAQMSYKIRHFNDTLIASRHFLSDVQQLYTMYN